MMTVKSEAANVASRVHFFSRLDERCREEFRVHTETRENAKIPGKINEHVRCEASLECRNLPLQQH